MLPGLRERQSHPRFMTAMAVSVSLCSEFDEDMVASDGVSDPRQVFEWYVVEGLARTIPEDGELRGLPGIAKARQCLKEKTHLSARRYLKTPTTFGFHGVYRTLARTIGIESAGRLGEVGYDLLSTWAEEQDLEGFHGTLSGPGRKWRQMLIEAVKDGLKKGAVDRQAGWTGWEFFRDHLAHHRVGRREARVIRDALTRPAKGHRGEVFRSLVYREGQRAWRTDFSERKYHKFLKMQCGPELKQLIRTVGVYETFARLLQDAFDDCLQQMSKTRSKTKLSEMAQLKGIQLLADRLPSLFENLIPLLEPYGESVRFIDQFGTLGQGRSARLWTEAILDHHVRIQREKPPNGKAPWFERFDDGSYIIRPQYVREKGGRHDNEYLHGYRTPSLWSFARDLRLVR